MEMDMVDKLVRHAAIVLQNIVLGVGKILLDGMGHALYREAKIRGVGIWQLVEHRCVVLWDDKDVAVTKWADIHEREDALGLEDLVARDLVADNPAKDASRHGNGLGRFIRVFGYSAGNVADLPPLAIAVLSQ
jgi:hypothetical protein